MPVYFEPKSLSIFRVIRLSRFHRAEVSTTYSAFCITRLDLRPRFFRALRQVNPDVIHAHFAWSGKNAVRLAQVLKPPAHRYSSWARRDGETRFSH